MINDRDAERVWKLIKKIGFCMLSTHDGEDIRARPMAAHADRDGHAIYFLTDADSHKDEDIQRSYAQRRAILGQPGHGGELRQDVRCGDDGQPPRCW